MRDENKWDKCVIERLIMRETEIYNWKIKQWGILTEDLYVDREWDTKKMKEQRQRMNKYSRFK
jgi:hypothetical protein